MPAFPSNRQRSPGARGPRATRSLVLGLAFTCAHCANLIGLSDHERAPSSAGASAEISGSSHAGESEPGGTPNSNPPLSAGGNADASPDVSGSNQGGQTEPGGAPNSNPVLSEGGNGGADPDMSGSGRAGHTEAGGAPSSNPPSEGGSAGEPEAHQRCAASSADANVDSNPIPKSCRSRVAGTGTDCGTGKNFDCCASLAVTGGPDQCLEGSEQALEDFVLDKFEVTIGRFKQFLEAPSASRIPAPGAGTHPKGANCVESDAGWDPAWNEYLPASSAAQDWYGQCGSSTWTQPATVERDWLPASCISWFEAQAFCIWDGGYLPSWSELSYAARGGNLNSKYPWGTNAIDAAHAVYASGGDEFARPVGSLPAGDGRWHHSDLAGNVWEWCSYNAFNGGDCNTAPCRCNSVNRNFIHARAFGGSYGAKASELTSTYFATGEEPTAGGFIFLKPEGGDWANLVDVGFRCARRPTNASAP